MKETAVHYYPDLQQGSIAAAREILQLAQAAVMEKGLFSFVLAGGQTPKPLYELLSQPPIASQMPWQQSHFFWGDERWLSSSHPDSNFNMVHETLLARVQIPPQNIHQVSTGHQTATSGAGMYEKHLRDFFLSIRQTGINRTTDTTAYPEFDLILLGMGADGHTASLFPDSPVLEERKRWIALVDEGIGEPPVQRITMTLPVLNHARNIMFLVAGPDKKKIIQAILHEPDKARKLYPAARVKPAGKLTWIVAEK